MTGKDLLEAMSYVDEKYVEEAEQPIRRKTSWKPIAAAAACFCLILLAARFWMPMQTLQKTQSLAMVEAAKGAVTEDEMMDTIVTRESAAANSFAAAAMVPLQITIRAVDYSDGILTCTVTDPGTGSFAADETIKLSLTEDQQQEWLPESGKALDLPLLTITFLPDDSELIHPMEISIAEDANG